MFIDIPMQIEQQINHIAESEHKSVSTWLVETLAKVIEDYQDLQAIRIAKAEIERGESEFLSLDDAMKVIYELDS